MRARWRSWRMALWWTRGRSSARASSSGHNQRRSMNGIPPARLTVLQRGVQRLGQLSTLVVSGIGVFVCGLMSTGFPPAVHLQLAFTGGEFRSQWWQWMAAYGHQSLFAQTGWTPFVALSVSLFVDSLFIPCYVVFMAALYLRAIGIRSTDDERHLE